MKKIGIIGAMEVEVSLLKSRMTPLTNQEKVLTTKVGNLDFYEGMLNGVPAVVVKSGIGKVNAALCAQRLILSFGVTNIINTGIAGAMASGLGVMDFVVSTNAVYHDMDATGFGYKPTEIPQMATSSFPADAKMIECAKQTFAELDLAKNHKIVEGGIATGDQFISDKAIKNHIKQICNPACVEMEGAAIAHACYLNNTPFIIIRCMSDMADDGHESVYSFNEETAATLSANLVLAMVKKI